MTDVYDDRLLQKPSEDDRRAGMTDPAVIEEMCDVATAVGENLISMTSELKELADEMLGQALFLVDTAEELKKRLDDIRRVYGDKGQVK